MILPKNFTRAEMFTLLGGILVTLAVTEIFPVIKTWIFNLIPTSRIISALILLVAGWYMIYRL